MIIVHIDPTMEWLRIVFVIYLIAPIPSCNSNILEVMNTINSKLYRTTEDFANENVNDTKMHFSNAHYIIIPSSIHDVNSSELNHRYGNHSKEETSSRYQPHSSLLHEVFFSENTVVFGKGNIDGPRFECSNETGCDAYSTDLQCSSGVCQCRDGYCMVYDTTYVGFIPWIRFWCGACGQLGSQCNRTTPCNPPGECGMDKYCHCSLGEHNGPDICVVSSFPTSMNLFMAGFLFFLLLGLGVVSYSFCVNYRRTGYVVWCGNPTRARPPTRRSRGNIPFGPPKSPAFTMDIANANGVETEDGAVEPTPSGSGMDKNSNSDFPDVNIYTWLEDQPVEIVSTKAHLGEPKERLSEIAQNFSEEKEKRKDDHLVVLAVSNLTRDTGTERKYSVKQTNQTTESVTEDHGKTDKLKLIENLIEDTSGMTSYFEKHKSTL